jgi:hypothetical protein
MNSPALNMKLCGADKLVTDWCATAGTQHVERERVEPLTSFILAETLVIGGREFPKVLVTCLLVACQCDLG